MKLIIIFMCCIIQLGCNSKFKNEFVKINNEGLQNETKKYALDLSKEVMFNFQTNKMKIRSKQYFKKLVQFLNENKVYSKIIVQTRHGEGFYIETQMSNGLKFKEYIVNQGLDSTRIESFVGFDFGKEYSPKLNDSSMILLISKLNK